MRIHRWVGFGTTIATLMLFMVFSGGAQPMKSGIESGALKCFVVDGKLKTLDSHHKLTSVSVAKDAGAVTSIHGGTAHWNEQILVVTENSLFLGAPGQGDFIDLGTAHPGPGELLPWGEHFLWVQSEPWRISVIGPEGIKKSLGPGHGLFSKPYVIDDRQFLVLTGTSGYEIFSSAGLDTPKKDTLPFPNEQAKVSVSQGMALIWSSRSPVLVLAGQRQFPPQLGPPVYGVKVVPHFGFVVGLKHSLLSLNAYQALRSHPSPAALDQLTFDTARFVPRKDGIFYLGHHEDSVVHLNFFNDGRASGGTFAKQTIKSVVTGQSTLGQSSFLLTESRIEEAQVEPNGRAVINPKTGEPDTRVVVGYQLRFLDSNSRWTSIELEPRERLVGPAQIIGQHFVYATQFEPLYREGQAAEIDRRFPHPKVVLHSVDARTGEPEWKLDLDRGDAPSMARLPEEKWPTAQDEELILFTTETDKLSAVNLNEGTIAWTSQTLPLDESRPLMLDWDGGLALLATKHTSQKLVMLDHDGKSLFSVRVSPFFNDERRLNLLGVLVICAALLVYIYLAGKKKLFIRRIAGLEALDEAVGRATEMGKPVLYVTGLADVDDIQTLASLSILSHVAKKTAEYDTPIIATTARAVTFSAAQEVVRDAFTIAGRPDSFSVESVQYISDDQFGYAAGVDGLMLREEPAANFYMGKFYAESLIFAETGHATGAIQIAGTAAANQLPFFVAACDYTLIGEELFAASAYLSGDPLQVGSLRGQDVGKAIVMILLILFSFYATYQSVTGGVVS